MTAGVLPLRAAHLPAVTPLLSEEYDNAATR